jgi:hypothetical protein
MALAIDLALRGVASVLFGSRAVGDRFSARWCVRVCCFRSGR